MFLFARQMIGGRTNPSRFCFAVNEVMLLLARRYMDIVFLTSTHLVFEHFFIATRIYFCCGIYFFWFVVTIVSLPTIHLIEESLFLGQNIILRNIFFILVKIRSETSC